MALVTCQSDPIHDGYLGLSFAGASVFITIACGISLCFGPRYSARHVLGQQTKTGKKKKITNQVGGEKYC